MADLEYYVDLEVPRSGHLHVVSVGTAVDVSNAQVLRFVEIQHVLALNFGKIIAGNGRLIVRGRRKKTI